MYYQKNHRGNYVGYHHQGGENYKESGSASLSLGTLDSNRPLFMGNSPDTEWNGDEYDPDGRMFQIEFRGDLNIWKTVDLKEYWDLTVFDGKRHSFSSRLLGLITHGYSIFIVEPEGESQEGFLVNAREHVVGLQPYLQSDRHLSKF